MPGLLHTKGSGSHVRLCPRPCSSTDRWARLTSHRHQRTSLRTMSVPPPSVWCVLSCPFTHVTAACVSSSRDWAVSTLARTSQQDMVISLAPPHLGAPFLLFERFTSDTRSLKIGDDFSSNAVVLGVCSNACFTLRRATSSRPCHAKNKTQHTGESCDSEEAFLVSLQSPLHVQMHSKNWNRNPLTATWLHAPPNVGTVTPATTVTCS